MLLAAADAAGQAPPPSQGQATKQVADFTLPDVEGRRVSLSSFQGKTGVLIAFVKGTWCPHCADLILQLQQLKATDLARIPVLVISPEPAAQTIGWMKKIEAERGFRLSMQFLVDSALRFAPRYGLTREVSGTQGRPPNVVLLDPTGRQVWSWTEGHDKNLAIGPSLHAADRGDPGEPALRPKRDGDPMSFWASRRVLLTGGGGFLGRALLRTLSERGRRPRLRPGDRRAGPSGEGRPFAGSSRRRSPISSSTRPRSSAASGRTAPTPGASSTRTPSWGSS